MSVTLASKPPASTDLSVPKVALALEGVSRRYGQYQALEAVDLTVGAGEFVSLLGPSGSGKTTMLRLIAGFDAPSSGRIEIGGRDMTDVPAHRRPVGVVFQNLALFPHLTVAGNVAFGLQVRRTSRTETASRVADALRLVELPNLQDRRIHELSGGQRQRVALARALVLQPDVLLLDEPLSALDLKLRQMLQDELKQIQRRSKATFVFVTHDQDEALRLSDRIAVVNRGRIEQMGTARDIYDRPQSAFVARFVGDTNLMPGHVVDVTPDSVTIALDGLGFVATAPCYAKVAPGDAAALSIRPENISFGEMPFTMAPLEAKLTAISYAGARIRTTLDVGGQTILADLASRPGDRSPHEVGGSVRIGWDAANSVIVPTKAGEVA